MVSCHMGLPCGTCSRAREKAVSAKLRQAGAPNPRPLRDPDHLFGVAGLTPSEATRVAAANEVYTTAEVLMYHIFLLGIFYFAGKPRAIMALGYSDGPGQAKARPELPAMVLWLG